MFLGEILFSVNFTAGFICVYYLYLMNGKADFYFLSPSSFLLSHRFQENFSNARELLFCCFGVVLKNMVA